jgi:hypothetical protein
VASGQLHAQVTLPPGKDASATHWIEGWVGHRTGLDDVENSKFLTLLGLEIRPLVLLARSQSLYRLRYPGSLRVNEYAKKGTSVKQIANRVTIGWLTILLRRKKVLALHTAGFPTTAL